MLDDKKVLPESGKTFLIPTLIDKLLPDYRLALILKYWYAMPLQDLAYTLNSTVSAIKSKLFRARKMMAQTAMKKQTVISSSVLEGAFGFSV